MTTMQKRGEEKEGGKVRWGKFGSAPNFTPTLSREVHKNHIVSLSKSKTSFFFYLRPNPNKNPKKNLHQNVN